MKQSVSVCGLGRDVQAHVCEGMHTNQRKSAGLSFLIDSGNQQRPQKDAHLEKFCLIIECLTAIIKPRFGVPLTSPGAH